jgi:hypothetical protein
LTVFHNQSVVLSSFLGATEEAAYLKPPARVP